MQEDIDDSVILHHGENALRVMEEPFYKLLGQNNPAYPHRLPLCNCDLKNIDDNISKSCIICTFSTDSSTSHSNHNLKVSEVPWSLSDIVKEKKQFTQGTLCLQLGLNVDGLSIAEKRSRENQSLQVNVADKSKHVLPELHSGNYSHIEDFQLLEGRSTKQFAASFNRATRDEMLDSVPLFSEHKLTNKGIVLREMMANTSTRISQNDQGRTSSSRKTQVKKPHKKELADLRTLLLHCSEAVSENNYTVTSHILNTTRQRSSVCGVDTQRLPSCLVDCLEVRLAGTGQVYHKLMTETCNVVDILKVYQLALAVCPFKLAPYYFSNKIILDVSKGKPMVHIIDFGICFGFQWPSLFEQLSRREYGPPKVRITGIELPQQGFRPNQINKNVGQLLADYASMFNVPFEYKGISSKWEIIRTEDLNIDEDDVLIVNCIFRMKNLGDETVSLYNSARDRVLNTIRMIKPKVFVHGVVNASYNTPFFFARFKEVMYHYSALFDMLDKTVPRDNETRMFLERGIYLWQLLNVITCEGSERIERPENYKQWKSRNLNAGIEQLPLNPDIVKVIRDMVGKYHKYYLINEADRRLLLGWKGRILYAISTWRPSESCDGN